MTFRTTAQEPPVYTDGMTTQLVSFAQSALAGGDGSKFSELIDWSALVAAQTAPEPQPTGYSTRWYVSRLAPGAGQVIDDGPEGNFKPTLLERIQPYAVYVPSTYRPGSHVR